MNQDKEQLSPNDLSDTGGKVRLFTEAALGAGTEIEPTPSQAHYLLHVMRSRVGEHIRLFNGRDGEWRARVTEVSRRSCLMRCETRIEPQSESPDLWLLFAPIKKTPADYVAQKATELGVRRLMPVFTKRTVVRRVNTERLRANAVEAAEQSGRLSVPEVVEASDLDVVLNGWDGQRRLIFCDEGGDAAPIATALSATGEANAWAVLAGPEGGFDAGERAFIRALPFVIPVTLGPRIMRADTASLAALAIWQALRGDWRKMV